MKKETIDIETPEKIVFSYAIASTGTRIVALGIDSFIQVVTVVLVYLFFFIAGIVTVSGIENSFMADAGGFLIAFVYLAAFLIQWGYFIVFEVIMAGQSPGKRLMKIRVIRTNGGPLDFPAIVLRNLVRAVDMFPVFHLLGGLVSIVDPLSRRIGDIASDTIVVKAAEFSLKEPDFSTVFHSQAAAEGIGILTKKLTEEELYILRRFLNQKHTLSADKKNEVANKLAHSIKGRLAIKSETGDPVEFIERIYKAHTATE